MIKLLCVIGNPISHSLSPKLFNAVFEKLEIKDFYYFASLQTKESLKDFFKAVKNLEIKGISVTIPFKLDVIEFLDQITDNAKAIGAVNTIVNNNGVLTGDNTDVYGIFDPLKKFGEFKNKKIGILGAGGASLAAIQAAKMDDSQVFLFNRTIENAKKIQQKYDLNISTLKDPIIKEMDVLINTTSVGMIPNDQESPINIDYINEKMIIFDAVYRPIETKLILAAKKVGAKTITGDQMFVEQAKHQLLAYTGIDISSIDLLNIFSGLIK